MPRQCRQGQRSFATGDSDADDTELIKVTGDRRLGSRDAFLTQQIHQLGLARDHVVFEQLGDAMVALLLRDPHVSPPP